MHQAAATLTGIPQPGIALPTTLASNQMQPIAYPAPRPQMQQGPAGAKQRVFTGSVTKLHDNFGFVDEDVFFQTRFIKPVLCNAETAYYFSFFNRVCLALQLRQREPAQGWRPSVG